MSASTPVSPHFDHGCVAVRHHALVVRLKRGVVMKKTSSEQGGQKLLKLARLSACPAGQALRNETSSQRASKSETQAINSLKDQAIRSLRKPGFRFMPR